MATTTSVKVAGLTELRSRMLKLNADVVGKVSRAAVSAGAQVVRKEAIANAKRSAVTGNLVNNIIAKRLPKGEHGITEVSIVTVRLGKNISKKQASKGVRDAFYGVFVEFGTVNMHARPFLRPAYDQSKEAALVAIAERLRTRIEKAET